MHRVFFTNLVQKIAVESHIASLKNRSCYHANNCDILTSTGAIYAGKTFTQWNGRLTITNSLAKQSGGAVHLGAPSGGVSRCCLRWLWGCGRSIHLSLCFKFHNMSCLMHLHAHFFFTNLLEKFVLNNQIAGWRTGVGIMQRIVTSNSLAKWSRIFPCIFHFGSSQCYESADFPKVFRRTPWHLLGHRSHLHAEHLHPVRWHVVDRQFIGTEDRRRGAPWSSSWGSFEMLLELALKLW